MSEYLKISPLLDIKSSLAAAINSLPLLSTKKQTKAPLIPSLSSHAYKTTPQTQVDMHIVKLSNRPEVGMPRPLRERQQETYL